MVVSGPRPGSRGYTRAIVAAQMLAQIGAFALPALLPTYIARWDLSMTEAGWLVGIFFAAYVVMVPILVALTDRVPVRRVYMFGTGLTTLAHLGFALVADGFWSGLVLRILAGAGWAGTYMPGLKAIADPLDGVAQSRAVSWHTAWVGISGAASFAIAGFIDRVAGPEAVFLVSAATSFAAVLIAVLIMPTALPRQARAVPRQRRLLDFRPVFRNQAAMGWIAGYTVHIWGWAALRAWGVTFLTIVIGIALSIPGNEAAQRRGRMRVVTITMGTAAALSLLAGWTAGMSALVATLLVLLWNIAIYFDSSALTAGTVEAADKELRGATMGLHSMCGYAGGFIGPLGVGLALDLAGEDTLGWGIAFGHLAVVTLTGLLILRRLGARNPRPATAAAG
jgi:MFS family permease